MNRRRLVWVLVSGCIIAATAHAQWYEGTWAFPDTMGSLNNPNSVVANPLTGMVYISDYDNVVAFDPATQQKARVFRGYTRVLYLGGLEELCLLGSDALVVDAHTDTVMRQTVLPLAPVYTSYSSSSNKLYLSNPDQSETVYVYDAQSDSIVAGLPGWSYPGRMAWDSVADRVFVIDEDLPQVGVVDCTSDSVSWVPLPRIASGVVISLESRKAYCNVGVPDSLAVVDADSLRLVGMVAAVTPRAMAYNAGRNRLYLGADTGLCVFDCAGDTVVAFVPIADGVAGICFAGQSGRTYLLPPSAESVTVVDSDNTVLHRFAPYYDLYPNALAYSVQREELYFGMEVDYAVTVDARADTVIGAIDYNELSFYGMAFNPAGSKLYALSSNPDELLVVSSDGQWTDTLPMTASTSSAMLVDPGLNRLYIVENETLRAVDCNVDSVVKVTALPDIDDGLLVQPNASKLYIFPRSCTQPGLLRVYDCYRDTAVLNVYTGDEVPCAVYLPMTNRVYFMKHGPSFLYTLDVERDLVVDSVFVGRVSAYGRLLADPRNGLLYVLADGADSLCIVDARQDSVLLGVPIAASLDTMFLSEASNKLYLANRSATGPTYVFDLNSNTITDSLPYGPSRIGMVDERNDKLYFGSSAAMTVVDCRYDSVVAVLPSGGRTIRSMAWDPVNNRVFAGGGPAICVYRDDPYAVEEGVAAGAQFGLVLVANPVRGSASFRCVVPAGEKARLVVRDVLGRQITAIDVRGGDAPVNVTWSGADARGRMIAAGVYFAQLVAGEDRATVKVVLE